MPNNAHSLAEKCILLIDACCSVSTILLEKSCFCGMGALTIALYEQSNSMTKKNNDIFVRMAKRVRDAEGGVSQCGEQRSTVAVAKPVAARPAGKRPPKKYCSFG